MRKLFLILSLALILVFLAGCSSSEQKNSISIPKATEAQYTDKNGVGYNEDENGALTVANFKNSKDTIAIPSKYKGKKVKEIGRSSFKMSKAKEITIPDTVTKIEDYAFAFSRNLEKITLPDTVTSIGNNAFSGCVNLKEIKLPKKLKSIGVFSFDATGLESVVLPKALKKVDEYSFAECLSLKSVTVKGKNTEIADTAFNKSTSVKITASKGSKAESFAKNNGIELTLK